MRCAYSVHCNLIAFNACYRRFSENNELSHFVSIWRHFVAANKKKKQARIAAHAMYAYKFNFPINSANLFGESIYQNKMHMFGWLFVSWKMFLHSAARRKHHDDREGEKWRATFCVRRSSFCHRSEINGGNERRKKALKFHLAASWIKSHPAWGWVAKNRYHRAHRQACVRARECVGSFGIRLLIISNANQICLFRCFRSFFFLSSSQFFFRFVLSLSLSLALPFLFNFLVLPVWKPLRRLVAASANLEAFFIW